MPCEHPESLRRAVTDLRYCLGMEAEIDRLYAALLACAKAMREVQDYENCVR
jgi:hypothetical protein